MEYLEIHNIGSSLLDLTDVRFTKGIDFDFASGSSIEPGAYLLVVRNLAAFEEHYGTDLPVAGEYQYEDEGRLENGGERIKLALGAFPLHDFVYDNNPPWPEGADARGFALELAHTSDNAENNPLDPLGHGIPSNWRLGGSPGTSGSKPFDGPDPLSDDDNDGLPAFLEHALGSDDNDPSSGPDLISAGHDEGFLTFSFQRHLAAHDVQYRVEISRDLLTWSSETTLLAETGRNDGTSWVTYRSDLRSDETTTLFMRLRATMVPPLP